MKKLTDKQNENELNCWIIELMQFDGTNVLLNIEFRSCLSLVCQNERPYKTFNIG